MEPAQTKQLTPQRGSIEHERLSSLINSMADGVIAIDDQQKVAVYNGAALNIIDVNTAITGKQLGNVLKLIDKQGQPVNVSRLVSETTTPYSSRDFHLQYVDGSIISLYLSIAPVRLGYGQTGTKGHVVLIRDITREKSLEEERDEFISVVSHELRTPITIAEGNIGNAQLLAEKSGDVKKIGEALKQAHAQIIFLSELVNDLATLSRAEQNKLTVNVESLNVHSLVTSLIQAHHADAEKKGLTITADLDSQLELLNSSKLYVEEILQNFVTNAIKYTEKGGVVVGAHPKPGGVEFYVRDSGIGISRNDQLKIFEKFFRSEDFRTRQNNGTGLGLYVTLKLAHLVHAEINVTSELNKGSVFTIFVPNLK